MRRAALTFVMLAGLVAAVLTQAPTPTLRGRVVAVADGDTLTILDAASRQVRVRLNGIDAPETGQPFAAVSKQALSALVFGQDVTVLGRKLDRYGRLIGTVLVGQTNANLEQLRTGLSWYYREYAADVAPEHRPVYEAAEAAARQARLGLWQDAAPIAPWIHRNPKAASATTAPVQARPTGQIIGNKNSRIFHAPDCPDYDRVAPQNRVYFTTEAAAVAAGFRKARNC